MKPIFGPMLVTGLLLAGLSPIPTVQAGDCPYEDQSGGFGGQSGSCSFDCPGGAGTLTASIDADDAQAQVSVTGSCGVHDAHCSGMNSCSSSAAYSGSHDGSCSGDSDEVWDSGIYINCYANAEDSGPDGGEYCPVTKPVLVCVQPPPIGAPKELRRLPSGLVESIGELELRFLNFFTGDGGDHYLWETVGSTSAHMFIKGESTIGIICHSDGICFEAQPTRSVHEGGVTWSL